MNSEIDINYCFDKRMKNTVSCYTFHFRRTFYIILIFIQNQNFKTESLELKLMRKKKLVSLSLYGWLGMPVTPTKHVQYT